MKCLDSTFQLVHVPSRNCWRNDLTVQVTRNSSPVSAYMAIGPWLSVLDSFFVCMGLPFGFGLWNSNCLPAGNPTHSRHFVVRGSDSGRVSFGLPGSLPGRLLFVNGV